MRKQLLSLFSWILFMLLSSLAYSQSVSLVSTGPIVCLGDQTTVEATVTGGPGTQARIDWENDGTYDITVPTTGAIYQFQTIYTVPGPKTLKVEVTLQGGGTVSATQNLIVYRLPIPSATSGASPIQCYKGNLFTLVNASQKTDNSISSIRIDWGDGRDQSYSYPFVGQTYSHTYNASQPYRLGIKVTDSVGCFKDTFFNDFFTVKPNLQSGLMVMGKRNCDTSTFLLVNTTPGVPFSLVNSYTWDFGDGSPIHQKQKPWVLPQDSLDYIKISHNYVINGTFFPAITIQDTTGCIDSFRIDKNSNLPKPENILIKMDVAAYLDAKDSTSRDSVCFGDEGNHKLMFRQTPNEFVQFGGGEIEWNFDDPPSIPANLNINRATFTPTHEFLDTMRMFKVKLVLWPDSPAVRCRKVDSVEIYVIGPQAQIEDKQKKIELDPNDKSQCQAMPDGFYQTVDFVNTSKYFRSEHVFRLWDFDDDFAPQCTSYLVPKAGFPPLGGWATAADQYNFSDGYWRQGGKIYPGKRLDCKYSADTLPMHKYRDWDVIYKWHRYGHDFMPWDTMRYTRNPADTLLPVSAGGKIWVQNSDTSLWRKPVYLNIATGTLTTTPGTYNDPIFGPNTPWPRVDTIVSRDVNGQPSPQDLQPYNRFNLRNGAPDPLVGFSGETKPNGKGGYGFVPRGTTIDPLNTNMILSYPDVSTNEQVVHHYDSSVENSTNSRMSLYQYLFNKGVQRCNTARLFLKDSANNVGNKSFIIANDADKLDSLDCEDGTQIQLQFMRPDATGLGKFGVECPGPRANLDQAGIRFQFGPTVGGKLGDYPGISPDCGQAWVRINLDSMADRMDNTPCILDNFINYSGIDFKPNQFSTTPGGLQYPGFSNAPDFGGFQDANFWSDPGGTSFWYHYGPGVASGFPLTPPTHPFGDVTIGLLVGTGLPTNPCISDTVWYHNFLTITDLDARFYVDPVYTVGNNAPPTNGSCKLYCKSDWVNFVYIDSTQRDLSASTIFWGDNSYTVDSFYYGKPGLTNGYFVDGFRRVRHTYYTGPCGQDAPVEIFYQAFPNGLPGINVDTLYIDNFTKRLYDPVTNPLGSLRRFGPNTAGDSVLWQECNRSFWVANTDSAKTFYLIDLHDRAKMLLPVQHRYWSSSFEDDCRQVGSVPRAISHMLVSIRECKKQEFDTKLLVRGVINFVRTRNEKLEWDTIFCKNEPVHFYDSVRYWRHDCSISNPPNGNPNYLPNYPFNLMNGPALNPPFDAYHFDTANYWRAGSVDINDYYPNGSFIEKLKYYFGDGDSAMTSAPIHKYKQSGRYKVTMLSKDRVGCWDTTYCWVNISEPKATPVVRPGTYRCGTRAVIYDRSTLAPIPGFSDNKNDSLNFVPETGNSGLVNRNYWWFGERKTADTALRADANFIDTAIWNYRTNGTFRIKLVVETAQGCKDTGFTNIYIEGPRPKITVISDTVGCAPFSFKVVNIADVEGGQGPNDKPTVRTDIMWGDQNNQFTPSYSQYDTLTFIYEKGGVYNIFARGDDNNPQSDNLGCKIVTYPDVAGGNDYPITVTVREPYLDSLNIDKEIVCVDKPFLITNLSDTVSYTEFKYNFYSEDYSIVLDSVIKPNTDNKFTKTLADTGTYQVISIPTAFAPGLPQCLMYDTATIKVVKPYASFKTDTSGAPNFVFTNTSVSAFEYTWTAYKDNQIIATVDKVQSDRDWSFNFGKDTGDVIICLEAFTQDPAKPICVDKVCDTISYRFVVEMEIFNVFTPGNNDGKNDVFDIKIKGETKYDLVIYNRWGNKVFESTDAAKDWDGTNQNDGTECPAGTYFYVFKYELKNGEKKTLNGTVSLIRQN